MSKVKKVLQTTSSGPLLLNGSSSHINDIENIFEERLSCAPSRSPNPTHGCARRARPLSLKSEDERPQESVKDETVVTEET